MKGIIFNLLEQVIVLEHGEQVWETLLERASLSGAYASLGNYPDEQVSALVEVASDLLNIPSDGVLRWFGNGAIPLLAERFPAFFTPYKSTTAFIKTANSIIHPEVRKLYAGARCPHFQFSDLPDGSLLMGYHSARQLCAFAHGLIEGAAMQFGERALVDHVACMKQGDNRCELHIRTERVHA